MKEQLSSAQEMAQFYELSKRILQEGEHPPKRADIIYLFGETSDNEESVLAVAKDFDGPIALVGHDDTQSSGFPGFGSWREKLVASGIAPERIVPIFGSFDYDREHRFRGNTMTEALAFIDYAKTHSLRSAVVVAPAFHLTRCFAMTVSVALRDYPELNIYPALGKALAEDGDVAHSQGVMRGTRIQIRRKDLARLGRWQEQNGIPAAEEAARTLDGRPGSLLAYLERRPPATP
jgi:hypothetical protein